MSATFSMQPCTVPGIEAVIASTRHRYPKHFHVQFGIGLMEHGAQKSLSGRGQVEAGPGDIITVNPSEVHDGRPIGEQPRSWRMLYLEPAVIAAASPVTLAELAQLCGMNRFQLLRSFQHVTGITPHARRFSRYLCQP